MNGVEITAEGGPVALVLLTLSVGLLTILLGGWVAVVAYRGYRRTGEQPLLYLAAGLVMLATVHTSLRFALATAGATVLATNAAAVASQLVGLSLLLYAIYGRPEERRGRAGRRAPALAPLPAVPAVVARIGPLGTEAAVTAINALSAGVGLFVAVQAYRGYRRHGSRPMLFLAVGIALLTALPFVVGTSLDVLTGLSDAAVVLGMMSCELGGLASILYSLTRA